MKDFRFLVCDKNQKYFYAKGEFQKHPFGADRFFSEKFANDFIEEIKSTTDLELTVKKVEI